MYPWCICKGAVWKQFLPLWIISHMLWVDSHARPLTVQTLICLSPQPLQQLTQIQYCHLVWLFHKCWTQSLWRTDRAHKNTAKCYNTGRSNFTFAFSITLFALESCQVSFTWNVCSDELKTSVVLILWVRGCEVGVFEDQRDGLEGNGPFKNQQTLNQAGDFCLCAPGEKVDKTT